MVKFSAGSYDLNKWLHGGYDSDVITTVYGAPGTGKTNFCLLAAVSQAKKGKKVIFVDTEGGFSSERVKQMLGKDSEKCKNVLKNIFLLKPTNFNEQKQAFRELEKHVKNQVSLIVVDGMTMLYRLDFADARNKDIADLEERKASEPSNSKPRNGFTSIQKINSELTKQLKQLAEISRKQNIPIIVTNQIYKWDNESRMVGGDILKYWSKCLIEVTNENGRRIVRLVKHRSLPEKSFTFQIYDGGIRKKGWI